MSTLPYTQSCQKFSFAEIQSATQNFNDALVVGKGGFGKVYKATITVDDEEPFSVAIKRLNLDSSQGATEFWAEIEMLTKLRHCNLVSLIGYCDENSEMILIYEFMPHGTLDDHLHKKGTSLSWVQRLKISIGAARGLHYLHTGTGTQHGVIHRDVKSTNILLDEDYAAKISDFGLAKISPINSSGAYVKTDVRGTFGYLDPEYFLTGRLTRKSDVFAFGVVLFELLCGRVAVDNCLDDDESSLVKWARESIKKGKLPNILDLKIKNQISPKCLKEFVQTAYGCLSSESENRPEMAEIVVALQRSLSLQNKFDTTVKPVVGISSIGRMIKWPFNSVQSDRQLSTTEDSVDHGSSSKEDRSTNIADKVKSATITPSPLSQDEILQSTNLKSFSFHVLKAATRNFRPEAVRAGGFRFVFKGWIDEQSLVAAKLGTGTVMAVKRFQGHHEWLMEIKYLGRLYHPNLVQLIGYCLEDDQRLLVYEYMNRGSLENHVFRRSSYFQPLPWNLRLKVALGAAKGLAYLHCPEVNVIYRDFKSSHILIDSEYNAKLYHFELAKDWPLDGKSHVSTRIMGTYGYAAPEYIATGHLTKRSDIYSFGVVLLEILAGRRCIDKNLSSNEQVLVDFAKPYLTSKRRILHIMDQRIAGQYTSKVAMRAADLAMKCISSQPKSRPTADELVKVLEQLQEMQEGWENRIKERGQKHNGNKNVG